MNIPSTRIRKIVYYGPGRAGKSANLRALAKHCQLPEPTTMRLQTDTSADHAAFEILELPAGSLPGLNEPLQLLAVPGQLEHAAVREALLHGSDGVVFVVDSRARRLDANLVMLDELGASLHAHGSTEMRPPLVLQFNHRDSLQAMSMDELRRHMARYADRGVPACAKQGMGVADTLAAILPFLRQPPRDRRH